MGFLPCPRFLSPRLGKEGVPSMGSVIKKRRKKIRKHKYKKLRKRMRFQRR